jgi:predicted homoserine dehydrogenase-like protein
VGIVDDYLRRRDREGRPIEVGIVGAGFMARGLIRHITTTVPGMRVAAVCCRDPEAGERVLRAADGDRSIVHADAAGALERTVASGAWAVTEDVELLSGSARIDVLVDVTGAVEYGAHVALTAIRDGKSLVSLNAEVDATVGPILDALAREAGVPRSIADGDQPAVQLRLAEFAARIGLVPRLMGNVKGLHDVRRNPTTQQAFAQAWGQRPRMVTSFADGTKVNFEQGLVANALGFGVQATGMRGADFGGHVNDLVSHYDLDELRAMSGAVDYVVGARPGPGVFCLAEAADSAQRDYLKLFKLGPGPLYCLYRPYHLCHLEVPTTIAATVGFGATLATTGRRPTVEVAAFAKVAVPAGTRLDGGGGYLTYGLAVNAAEFQRAGLLPMGVAEGCVVRTDIPMDRPLTYDDIELPAGRVVDSLRERQASLPG